MADTTLSIHKILCPTDFSAPATAAFAEAVRLARWFGAKVVVLHVRPLVVPSEGGAGYVYMFATSDEDAREAKLAEMRRFIDATDHLGVPLDTVCREGNPCVEILQAIRETGADLVVMGTHGRSGFKRLVLGSVTETILRDAPVPILTVGRDIERRGGPFRRIVCATDISERSAGTIAVAKALADEGAKRFALLNVIEDGRESVRGDLERAALAALEKLIPDQTRESCRIAGHVAFGEADREILRLAAEDGADIIVMGARRRGALAVLFDSTVRGVVREAMCPVLLVPTGYAWPETAIAPSRSAASDASIHLGGRP